MSADTGVIQVRVDNTLKKEADRLYKSMGLDTPTAIRFFLKQSLLVNGLPFIPITEPIDGFYNPYNQARIQNAIKSLDDGKGTIRAPLED